MKCSVYILIIVLMTLFETGVEAQITPNYVDSLGFKQGLWHEFKVPTYLATENIGIKTPKITSEYYYLTKDRDRKFFPIIECIGKYINGLKTGVWVEYYGNGNIKSKIEFKKGIPNGKCEMFWGNGVLKEKFSINSNDSTQVLMYNQTGKLLIEKKVLKKIMIKEIYEN